LIHPAKISEEANRRKWWVSYRWSIVTILSVLSVAPFLRYDELRAENVVYRCLPDSPKLGLGFRVRVRVSANRDWTTNNVLR